MVTWAKTVNYSVLANNCCTGVVKSLHQVIGDEGKNKFNLSLKHINKRNFNFLGKGVPRDADDSLCDTVKGIGRAIIDTTASLPKTGIHIVSGIWDDNSKK
jgi:hypothetical protein